MNSRKPVLVAVVLGVVGLFFWLSVNADPERRRNIYIPDRLPQLYPLPEFSLLDSSGDTFTREDLRGTFWVVDFIFTTCAGPCPVMSTRMADLAEAFADNEAVKFLSISVNPEYDTPEVLRDYAARYNADRSHWHFLTGERDAIHRLAVEGFKLGSVEEPVMHSTRFALVDDQGFVRGYYEATEAEGSLELTRDLASLLP